MKAKDFTNKISSDKLIAFRYSKNQDEEWFYIVKPRFIHHFRNRVEITVKDLGYLLIHKASYRWYLFSEHFLELLFPARVKFLNTLTVKKKIIKTIFENKIRIVL